MSTTTRTRSSRNGTQPIVENPAVVENPVVQEETAPVDFLDTLTYLPGGKVTIKTGGITLSFKTQKRSDGTIDGAIAVAVREKLGKVEGIPLSVSQPIANSLNIKEPCKAFANNPAALAQWMKDHAEYAK